MNRGAKPARFLTTVLWRVLPFTVLVLVGLWLQASNEATRALSAQLEKAVQTEANDVARVTNARLTGVVDALTSLASNDFIINGLVDVDERHNYLPTFFNSLRLPGTLDARVTLADYRGRRIESNAPGGDYEGAPWIEAVMSGETVVELSPDTLLIAVPVWQFLKPDGMMVMEAVPRHFWSFLNLSTGPRVVEIWDRDRGRIHITLDQTGVAAPSGSDSGREEARWVRAESPVPGFANLYASVSQRDEVAFAPTKRLYRYLVVELVLSLLAIVAGIAATAYFATRPLAAFVDEIDRIGASGGLGYRIRTFGAAEFHGLSRSLNQMLENLESTTTSRDFFNGVLSSISEILIVTDQDGRIIHANRAATEATGWSDQELKQRKVFSIVTGLRNRHDESADPGEARIETALKTMAGSEVPVQVSVSHLSGGAAVPHRRVYVLIDITERMQTERKLATLAQYDLLTGLANRSLFQARLDEALAQGRRSGKVVALMLLDLDNFKDVNDTLGHSAGDTLLAQTAQRLRHATRETDTVARLGGDEFAVIATNIDSIDGAAYVAGKLIEAIKTPFYLDGNKLHSAISIGISVSHRDETDATTMFNHADFALYQAKTKNRSAFQFFDDDMNQRRAARKAVENELDAAIAGDQLVLHYQPKLNTISGEITGVEALVRWNHPERGLIPPGEFIEIAETTGRIARLSTWVLNAACKQQIAWREQGIGTVPIAVNISASQFKERDYFRHILDITGAHDIDPANIELEITESTIIHNVEDARLQLFGLHERGHKICIDDFGTGYSSLAYLRRYPIDALKIDRSFVMNSSEYTDDAVIVRAMVALAHSLKIKAVAEGVETLEQLEFLRRCNCPEVQGFYFCRPIPAADFVAWRAKHIGRPAAPRVAEIRSIG